MNEPDYLVLTFGGETDWPDCIYCLTKEDAAKAVNRMCFEEDAAPKGSHDFGADFLAHDWDEGDFRIAFEIDGIRVMRVVSNQLNPLIAAKSQSAQSGV